VSNELQIYHPLQRYPALSVQNVEEAPYDKSHKEVILATLNNKPIVHESKIEAENSLAKLIGMIIWESGINMTEEEQDILVPYMITAIMKDYSHLTLKEVEIAFTMGVRKKYGDFFGINVSTFCGWLYKFQYETKKSAMRLIPYIKKTEKPDDVSEDQKKYWHGAWINSCSEAYKTFCETGIIEKFHDSNNMLYDYIVDKMKLVKLEKEEADKIFIQAKTQYKVEKRSLNARNFGQQLNFKLALEKLQEQDAEVITVIQAKSKRLALPLIFKKLKDQGLDLESEIRNYEKGLFSNNTI
jgi:hypothetical protein